MADIVYVDDEVYLTDIFHSLFEGTYHRLRVFNDEFEAIESCLKSPPDVMFIDYRLNKMRGDQVAQKISESVFKILVTGDVQIDTQYEFDGVIAKPFRLVELLNAVEHYAER